MIALFTALIIGLHGPSVHVAGGHYNNINLGGYVRAQVAPEVSLQSGAYCNSLRPVQQCKVSFYEAIVYEPAGSALFLTAGLATGYRHAIVPQVAVGLKLKNDFRLAVVPFEKGAVLHLTKEF